jgi:hypothetical protein
MLAAHDAFRRDLVSLARAARGASSASAAKRQSVAAGWDTFKRQLHLHHTAEDDLLWPALRERLANRQASLSVLAEMEAEHDVIDPLLAAVDAAFSASADSRAGDVELPDAVDALVSALSGHLAHEERDGLPLIGATLTQAEWRAVGQQMGSSAGMAAGAEMFAWMLTGASQESVKAALGQLPPPVRALYKVSWRPKYAKTARW